MPCASHVLLQAQWRREAGNVALVRLERRRPTASICPLLRKNGQTVELDVYSFLTTTPNPLVATINHERMPVLLTRLEEFERWLNGTPAEALELAREHPPPHEAD